MRTGLFRLVVLFFTRPVKLSDVKALFGSSRRAPPAAIEPEEKEPGTPKSRRPPLADIALEPRWSGHDPDAAVDVSEQPLDTLPADLQDELRHLGPPKT
jgi:hypothetical protein